MNNRAIIYCRKSTDRDDKQQNSLESQIHACMRTIETNSFVVVDTLMESASAKKSGKRPIFDSLLSLCKKKKVDYIVVDEASRLSRNNTDSAKILGLLEEGYIKGICTTSQRYSWEQASELFILLLSFGMAKLDNDTRARHIKSRMVTCAEKWRCLWKTPFGYRNVTILKDWQVSRKGVLRDTVYGPIVEHIFEMRGIERKSLRDISAICKKLYWANAKHRYTMQGICKMLQNPFYIGMIRYSGITYQWEHEGFISTALFEKVRQLDIWSYVHDKELPAWHLSHSYLFKWIIRDAEGVTLSAEVKKDRYIYYRSQNLRSSCKINISQAKIESVVIEKLKEFVFPKSLHALCMKMAIQSIEKKGEHLANLEAEIQKELTAIKLRDDRLLNWYLEWLIEANTYESTHREFAEKKTILEAQKMEIKHSKADNLTERITEMFELVQNLSETYKQGDYSKKVSILRKVEFELSINNKKELTIEESKPLKALKMLGFVYGSATENRTPVTGMRILSPNH